MTKKIAFITFGHWASTIALAKHLTDSNIQVDMYIECFRNSLCNVEATDIKQEKLNGLIGEVVHSNSNVIRSYCPHVNFFYLRLISPMINQPLLGKISNIGNSLIIQYICNKLNKKKYDCVFLVGRYQADHLIYYHEYLKCKVYTCLHEVCNHQNPNYEDVSPLLKYLFQNKKKIVVHSNNCLNSVLNYKDVEFDCVIKANLGLSETWKYVQVAEYNTIVPEAFKSGYVLFIGGIDKYKGMDILLNTINILQSSGTENVNFVIAGGGYDSCLSEMREKPNVHIINRFLDNSEFAYLVRNSRCVICPYHSMSQSGVPLAAFALDKPLIASNLDGFKEYMENNVDGFLCDKENVMDFVKAINEIFDDNAYNNLCCKIEMYDKRHLEYAWENIVRVYLDMIYN